MRGIERVVAGALLVMAVTGTAVLARTSAPGAGPAATVHVQGPPPRHLVAPLPVVIAVPEAPPHAVVTHRAKRPAPALEATVARARPVEVPTVAPSVPARSAPAAVPAPPAAPTSAPEPPAAPAPAPATRVIATARPLRTKTYRHSHPRGHAWGHVKHAPSTPTAGAAQTPAEDPVSPPAVPPASPVVPAAAPADDQSLPEPENGNGNAWGRSKHDNGD
jgi:hypothetical protein